MPEESTTEYPSESLHVAAKSGSVESVKMLLASGVDPLEKDSNGKTALELAEEGGASCGDVATLLRPFGAGDTGDTGGEGLDTSPPASPGGAAALPEEEATPPGSPQGDQKPSVGFEETVPPEDIGAGSPAQSPQTSPKSSPKGSTMTKQGIDIKKRLASTDSAVAGHGGFMSSVAGYEAGPKFSFTSRGNSSFIRSTSTPAPGSYNLPDQDRDKFKAVPRFSFGVSSRFGLGVSPLKIQPGPGAYNANDPTLVQSKVGFGTSKRGKGAPLGTENPGPGAYELKSTVGDARMFTARGRLATSYLRSRSQPGPGAYSPVNNYTTQASPKCGFGTSTRGELASRTTAGLPGPGAYELQQYMTVGKDSSKFSATSRRRMHDLNSYVSPGPGSYNCHLTSFGY